MEVESRREFYLLRYDRKNMHGRVEMQKLDISDEETAVMIATTLYGLNGRLYLFWRYSQMA